VGGDLPGRVDTPDARVVRIGDVEVAGGIDRDVERPADRRADCVVTFLLFRVIRTNATGNRLHDLRHCIDAPNDVVRGVGDEEIAGLVDGDAERLVQDCAGGEQAVADVAAAACDRRHFVRRDVETANDVV